MEKIGIYVAEFAWSKVEPEEGVFTYDFFDEFLDLLDSIAEAAISKLLPAPTSWASRVFPP